MQPVNDIFGHVYDLTFKEKKDENEDKTEDKIDDKIIEINECR